MMLEVGVPTIGAMLMDVRVGWTFRVRNVRLCL